MMEAWLGCYIFQFISPSDAEKTITNRQTGWMLRTKLSHVDEGGVAAGLGALDSILLVDAEGCCADDEGNPCLPACVPNPDFNPEKIHSLFSV